MLSGRIKKLLVSLYLNTFDREIQRRQEKRWGIETFKYKGAGGGLAVRKDEKLILINSCHSNYLRLVTAEFDYFHSVVEPDLGADGTEVVDYRQPRLHVLRSLGEKFWFPSIVEDDRTVAGYIARYTPRPGDVVLDAGAFVGVTAFRFSRMVGDDGLVIALEPDPVNYETLVKNIELHGLKNVKPLKMGLAAQSGTVRFISDNALGSRIGDDGGGAANEVQVISLQDLHSLLEIETINFVKMDIEGEEVAIVEAEAEWIRQHPMSLAIASYHSCNLGRSSTWEPLERIFDEIGYVCESGFPRHTTTWARHPSLVGGGK